MHENLPFLVSIFLYLVQLRQGVMILNHIWSNRSNIYRSIFVDQLGPTVLVIKADRPLTRDMLNAPWLLTNRQFQWTGNGHSQLPLAELGKPSPIIKRLCTTGSNGRAPTDKRTTQFFTVWPWPLTDVLDLQCQASQGQGRHSCQKSRSKVKR